MLDDNLLNKVREQESFEWSKNRYYYDKNLTTLVGHAKKHLGKEYNRFKKIMDYDRNIIDDQAINDYKKISIENINQNKYINNRIYVDKNNGSINIVGDNNLETCLKPSISDNYKYVITTCFFRDNVYDFFDALDKYSEDDLKPVYKLMTINELHDDNSSNSIDTKEIQDKFILSLVENRSEDIVCMINEYYGNTSSYNKTNVTNEVNSLLDSISEKMDNLVIMARDNNLILDEIKTEEYNPEIEPPSLDVSDDEIRNILAKEEIKEVFVNSLELSDIYDIIMDLSIIYIYYKMFNDLDKLKKWCKYMHYIIQLNTLDNELHNNIIKTKHLLGYDDRVGNDYYNENSIQLNFYSIMDEQRKIKTEQKRIVDNMAKDYDDTTCISSFYCKKCNHYIYDVRRMDEFETNHVKCDKCNNEDLEFIISNGDIIDIFDSI